MTVASFRASARGQGKNSQPQDTTSVSFPSPIGVDAMTPIASMTPQSCIYTYNLMPSEYGLRSRPGSIEWSNALVGATGPIRTVLPFIGDREDRFNDRLFACNDQGIYDASSQGASPPLVFPWPTQGGAAGYVVHTHFTNDAGEHYLMAADETNGLVEYTESTGLWSVTAGVTGPDPLQVFFVTAHKNRLWLIEEDSSDAWYLPTGAKAGAAIKFNFGSQFREGGNLVGLYSWTIDGGDGVDDYLVAISREGGVVIYRGDDPANAGTWGLVGVWYVGRVPAGHRIASQFGGELYIISENGVVNCRALLDGADVSRASSVTTDKISRVVRTEIQGSIDQRGWEIRVNPKENDFIINSPYTSQPSSLAFVRDLTTQGWGFWRGVAYSTGDVYQGDLYYADIDGSLWLQGGSLDNVLLDGTPGVSIEFSFLTSYQHGGSGWKRAQFCRPHFISSGVPAFSVQARFDFDLAETSGGLIGGSTNVPLWDSAVWDTAVWGGGVTGAEYIQGLMGYGHYLAIAMKGTTQQRLTLASLEVQADSGGLL